MIFQEDFRKDSDKIQKPKNISMSRSRMKHIIPYIAILLLATVIIYSNAEKERTRITERCQDTFSHAIRTEKKLLIKQFCMQYRQENSPNSLSVEDKKDWYDQNYLIATSPSRHQLDSLFRDGAHKINRNISTAIGYTFNGKNFFSGDESCRKSVIPVQECVYRKDTISTTDIVLQAYIHIPFYVPLQNTYTYAVVFMASVALAICFLYTRRRKKNMTGIPLQELPETGNRTTDNARWIIISKEVWWDEKNHIIKKGETSMILTGESLKFFKLFLENKSFFLSYKNIYESYGLKDEAPKFKDRIYQSIKLLRKDLIGFGITIRSVRGRGYELIFQ